MRKRKRERERERERAYKADRHGEGGVEVERVSGHPGLNAPDPNAAFPTTARGRKREREKERIEEEEECVREGGRYMCF